MEFNLEDLLRPNIKKLKPYSSARTEFKGKASILLDANENPYNLPYNRYPDPFQTKLKERLSQIKGVAQENLFLGNGSDEIIDLLIRAFCVPQVDKILTFSPSYTMYITSAEINDVEVVELNLTADFDLPIDKVLEQLKDESLKIIFICTPNNPVGNLVPCEIISLICNSFKGLVVLDEAYVDFSTEGSMLDLLRKYPNLCVIQTLSKAYGLAGLRLGLGFGSTQLIQILNKIKPPYNVSQATQDIVLESLTQTNRVEEEIKKICNTRERLYTYLKASSLFSKVYPSEANFILAQTRYYKELYEYLCERGIVVRIRNIPPVLQEGLRFTIGTEFENKELMKYITEFETLKKNAD